MTTPRPARRARLGSRPRAGAPPIAPGTRALDLGPGVEVVLSVPPGADGPLPLLVFFHGAGGSAAHSLAAVGDAVAAAGVALLAPSSIASTWDLIAGGVGRDVAVLDAALERVFADLAVSRVALGGFSDGASYALSLGLANGDLCDAVLTFSPGFVAPLPVVGAPAVWIAHGTGDRVLPVARCGRRLARELAAGGYDVTYEEFDGGHVVRQDDLSSFLAAWLGRA
jgi:phospholipase/carboxylesterase